MAKDIYIRGTQNDWYEGVTFQLKDGYAGTAPDNLAQYADELIGSHMKVKGYSDYFRASQYSAQNKATTPNKIYDKIELFCKGSLAFLGIVLMICMFA